MTLICEQMNVYLSKFNHQYSLCKTTYEPFLENTQLFNKNLNGPFLSLEGEEEGKKKAFKQNIYKLTILLLLFFFWHRSSLICY